MDNSCSASVSVVSSMNERQIKKGKLIISLKNDTDHKLKGKMDILNKIRKQKEAHLSLNQSNGSVSNESSTSGSVSGSVNDIEASDSLSQVVLKQQCLLKKLNNENVKLIEENHNLRNAISNSNVDLAEENESLKQQLHISQQCSAHFIKKYYKTLNML